MAIYGRFGGVVTVLRRAVLEDVQKYDGRKADKTDRTYLEQGSYVLVQEQDGDKKIRLYHSAYLRADAGIGEITLAIEDIDREDLQV